MCIKVDIYLWATVSSWGQSANDRPADDPAAAPAVDASKTTHALEHHCQDDSFEALQAWLDELDGGYFLPIDFKGVPSEIRMVVETEARHRFRGCNGLTHASKFKGMAN